jgi:hypothetical protein
MSVLSAAGVRRSVENRDLRDLKSAASAASAESLLSLWTSLAPFDKMVLYRLLDRAGAERLTDVLGAADLGLLLGAREAGVAAPLVEDAPGNADLFRKISDDEFERLSARVRACT